MKKYLSFIFMIACMLPQICNALILKLDQVDSITFTDWNTGKQRYINGHTTTFEVKGKKFVIGCFEIGLLDGYSYNDYTTNNTTLYIYRQSDDRSKNNFCTQQNRYNRIRIHELKYLLLEEQVYKVNYIDASHLEIIPDKSSVQKESQDVLSCIYDINYFDKTFEDLHGKKIPISDLFEKGKLNLIYYTADYCQPCREAKDSMISLSNANKNINIVFVTGKEGDRKNFDEKYAGAKKKYYTDFQPGYPAYCFFDENGNYIPPAFEDKALKKYGIVK